MSVGQRFSTPDFFDVDATGTPYIGGQLYFYLSGTSTPAVTYSDLALTVPNANPVPGDSAGHFGSIWLDPTVSYKVILEDQNSVQIWAFDPVGPGAGGVPASSVGIIGEIRAFAGPSSAIPSGWYLPYGQAVSRTTYSSAYSIFGTTYGVGDGSTTFNLPDLRGRVLAGLDNMGGSAAGRVTAGVCGIAGATLGGAGGDQHTAGDTLSAVNTVTLTDPGHTHVVTAEHSIAGGGIAGGSTLNMVMGNITSQSSTTGITVTVTTEVTGSNAGAAQNLQPTMMMNLIIYLGA